MSDISDNRFMEFQLGEQSFALPLLKVKEVIQKPEIIPMPNMPSHFEGMINLRGQILGIFNIRKKLNAKTRDSKLQTQPVIIICDFQNYSVGMIVDEVIKVFAAPVENIKSAPIKENDPSGEFISSIIQMQEDLILVVNVNDLLEVERYRKQLGAA